MQKHRPVDHMHSLPVLKIKELNQGYTDNNSDRCKDNINNDVIVNTGDIIFSWSGTLLLKLWSGNKAGLNQHLFKVTSKKYPDWFIFEWINHYLHSFQEIARDKATTMGHIKRKDLNNATVFIPKYVILNKLNFQFSQFFEKRRELIIENLKLEEIKKLLLKKYF